MSERDARSVGELLLEGDLAMRRLLVDAERLDVAELTAALPSLLRAAEEFVGVLPRRGSAPGQGLPSIAPDPSLGRLRAVTDRMERLRGTREWLSSAPPSPQLSAVRDNLLRARDLVVEHHHAQAVPRPDVLADGAAARARVMHTLYVSAHAVVLAARHSALDRSAGARRRPAWRDREVGALGAIQHLAESLEQLAGEEVRRTFPSASRGEWRELPNPSRLRESMGAWEVEARRSLSGNATPADRAEVVRVQGAILAMGRVLLGVAAHQGVIDRDGFRDLVEPSLLEVEARVGEVRGMVQDLATRGSGGLDHRLARAGSEVVLAHTELVLDGTGAASPAVIARRTDLRAISSDVADALPAAVGVLSELGTSLTDPALVTNAVGLQHLINRLERGQGPRLESPMTPWVAPRDLALGRSVPPPDWVRAEIDGAVEAAFRALSVAITASTSVGLGGREHFRDVTGEGSPSALRPPAGRLGLGQGRSPGPADPGVARM
ncbi:hypothetical protein [Phycicoccus sp.]|uniref:hypothetical protein n=1 Tax=Phycicoccus sp. TaxID=1902410 RepID=UPI002CBEE6F9|nr:hypothetical protein [Phycicoccus sp.]HMM94054.1 hypothetical protein [Phycicoccus sp.]